MSLILEALRKSEAERRRGLPPDLHAELPPTPARRVPAGAGWWLAGAVACAALAGWLLLRERTALQEEPPAAPADAVAPTERSAPPPPALPARTPPAATRPASSASPGPSVATTSQPRVSDERATPAAPDRARTPATTPAPTTATTVASPAAPAPSPGETEASPASAAVPATTTTTPAGDGRVLSLSDLDPGTRKALPPLKLSMHLWNPDPSRRFVILDGQRLGEGDRVGEASIVRIERDGVLLEWHGRGVRVPVH